MRARLPDDEGYVERDGVRIHWSRYGDGDPTLLFLPSWTFFDSRTWRACAPYLSRHFRVITFDGPGSKFSGTPPDASGYTHEAQNEAAVAILDAVGVDRAVVIGLSAGGHRALRFAADHPDRTLGVIPVAPGILVLEGEQPIINPETWTASLDGEPAGLEMFNREFLLRPGGFDTWFHQFLGWIINEPHSLKGNDDALQWASEVPPDVTVHQLEAFVQDAAFTDWRAGRELLARVQCPALVIVGTNDPACSVAKGEKLAELLGGDLVVYEGADHALHRHAVRTNDEIRRFAESLRPRPRRGQRSWRRALSRPRRVLFLSSPIGLGHIRRDMAIADELRKLEPDVEVEWLTQPPATSVLERADERVHPVGAELASEVAHFEEYAGEHDLHCFQAARELDEVMIYNAMAFRDMVEAEHYDLWVGDEAWDVDLCLHRYPEMKRAPFVWLTDFVGCVAFPDGGEHEAVRVADFNADIIEHVERFPTVRDRALFVGNRDDCVDVPLAPDLPTIRTWTESHFDFPGYITGFTPIPEADRAGLRAELGYHPDERVCIVAVGGTGVGGDLLRKAIAAHDHARRRIAGLRMVVVCGPRIEPDSLPESPGLEKRAFVPDLYRHLAACDVAVVQGGLTTTMELTANKRPFLYFPLQHHFEQQFHVRHRLERYGAGRCLQYPETTPESLAEAMAEEIEREVSYLPVETDGAARAAARLAELL